jgi:hypothetical protein
MKAQKIFLNIVGNIGRGFYTDPTPYRRQYYIILGWGGARFTNLVFLGSRLWNYGIPSLKVGVLLFLR